jgi:hypothetical protein
MDDGRLIFTLPSTELAIHLYTENNDQELYFMVADIHAFIVVMGEQGVACSLVQSLSWGELTQITLPSGGKLGVYQPHHAMP